MRIYVLMILSLACSTPKDSDADSGSAEGTGDSTGGQDDGGGDDGGGDDDGGSGIDTTPGRFLGQLNAETLTVYEAGEVEGVEFDAGRNWGLCSGGVSFNLDASLDIEGTAGCSSYIDPDFEPEDTTIDPSEQAPYTMNFTISGSQTDATVKGVLVLEVGGEEVETPFAGTRDGDEVEASFDSVHGDDDNRFEISGTLTAAWVE